MTIRADELEAIRLVDREGLYQEAAAERMGVSRPTFARILARARTAIAGCLIDGRVLLVDTGHVEEAPPAPQACPVHGGPRRRGRHCQCAEERGGHDAGKGQAGPAPDQTSKPTE